MRLLRQALRAEAGRGGGGALRWRTWARVRPGHHLHLIDGSGFIFRAYHALPPLTRKSDGLPIGAVAGFCNMVWKMLQETRGADAPTHVAVIFDKSEVTFRNELYPDYKQNRPPAPDDLIPQFGLIREATRAFNLPCIEMGGFEADDIIATYATRGGGRGRAGDDHQRRQGPDAAGGAGHRDVRHAEEQADRAGRGVREIRGRAGAGDRRAGAGGRFGRQRAGRAGDRHQDRGGADPGIRRSRHAAGAGGRDQAAQAPRGADRPRRADPDLARPGDAQARRRAGGAAVGAGGARAGRGRAAAVARG